MDTWLLFPYVAYKENGPWNKSGKFAYTMHIVAMDADEMMLLVAREPTHKLEDFKMDEIILNRREFVVCENIRSQFSNPRI